MRGHVVRITLPGWGYLHTKMTLLALVPGPQGGLALVSGKKTGLAPVLAATA